MKKVFIVANWKSNKIAEEVDTWMQEVTIAKDLPKEEKEIILCPSFTLLPITKSLIEKHELNLELGAQTVSPFDEGSYTGEVNARQLEELVYYVIIGHSERRINFSEDNDDLAKRVEQALSHTLVPVFCVPDEQTYVPDNVTIVAYEPLTAIGTGQADNPENADLMAKTIKEKNPKVKHILYGGSVTSQNVHSFVAMPNIDGVLVGKASLDPHEFSQIISNS